MTNSMYRTAETMMTLFMTEEHMNDMWTPYSSWTLSDESAYRSLQDRHEALSWALGCEDHGHIFH